MTDIKKRCYRVHMSDQNLIVPNMYQDIADFARDLKYNWEHNNPITLQDGSQIMINPAFINSIDGPHDKLFVLKVLW